MLKARMVFTQHFAVLLKGTGTDQVLVAVHSVTPRLADSFAEN